MRLGERPVRGERLLARGRAGEHPAQLAPAGDAEVERRPDPLARQRQAVAGAVAGEEDAVRGRRPQRVREPVALVADGRDAEPAGDVARRLLDVVARLVGADADALLAARGHRPGVAVADQRAVDPDVEVGVAAARVRDGPRARARSARPAAGRSGRRRAPGASRARRRSAARSASPRSVSTTVARRGRSTFATSKRASHCAHSSWHSVR